MKCPNCSSDIPDGSKFCDRCGAPISDRIPDMSIPDPTPRPDETEVAPEVIDVTPSSTPEPQAQTTPPAQSDTPPQTTSYASFSAPEEEKVLGIAKSSMGVISIVLGAVGIIFSCAFCGGLFGILGMVAGFISLKTTNKNQGTIGLILSALAIIITIAFSCLVIFGIVSSQNSTY